MRLFRRDGKCGGAVTRTNDLNCVRPVRQNPCVKNIIIKPGSPLRKLFPLVRKTRSWCWKYHDRAAIRLVISGGQIPFLDTTLNFPEGVGLNYSTPLFWNGSDVYEVATTRTIALLAGRAKVFLDVGSNIGIYAVYAGVKFPQVKTFAFEPVPDIWKKNQEFHRANHLPVENVFNLALSDVGGPKKIFLPVFANAVEEEQMATLLPEAWAQHDNVREFEIQCTTLDAFAAAQRLPAGACCLKIDVENHEAAVLRGGKQFIGSRRPWIVCEILPNQEIDPATQIRRNNNFEIVALVQELGYAPFAITGDGFFRMTADDFTRPRGLKDFLLVPKEKVSGDVSYLSLENVGEIFAA
jgi:FkbM family methyltransferase